MFGLTRGLNKRPAEPMFTRAEVEERIRVCVLNISSDHLAIASKSIGEATRVVMARLQNMEEKFMSQLEDLLGAVEAQQTQIDSLITLTEGLHKQVIEAMGETITPSQKMRIAQVFEAVTANSVDIENALKANTPGATAGSVSGGPGLAEIKEELKSNPVSSTTEPSPAT